MSGRAIVIGGGLVGAACADVLGRRGLRVTLIEAGSIGAGATAAGMGHLVVMDDSPAQLALTARSLERWEALAPSLPDSAQYRPCGTIWVASDDEEIAGVRPKQALYHSANREAEVLDAAQLQRLEPALRPGLSGGLRVPGDGVVYAPVAAQFLAGRCGAELRTAEVVAIEEGGVRLSGGERLSADLIVVAAGHGAAALLPELPLRPRKGHLLITERGPQQIRHQLVELSYLKNAHGNDADSVAFNVQPRPTGQLLIGSSRQFDAPGREIDYSLLGKMLRRACDFVPGLARLSALRVWTGFRSASPDHLPIIGPHPFRPGVFLAVGHEGLGITTALGTAELLEHHLGGQFSRLSEHEFGLERFLKAQPRHGSALHA